MFRVVIWITSAAATISVPWSMTKVAGEKLSVHPALLPLGWIVLFLPAYLAVTRSPGFKRFVDRITAEHERHRWGADLIAMALQIGGYALVVWGISGVRGPEIVW